MPLWLQRPIEAAAVTMIGACVAYWFAPLFGGRHTPIDVSALQAMIAGALVTAAIYCIVRVMAASLKSSQQ